MLIGLFFVFLRITTAELLKPQVFSAFDIARQACSAAIAEVAMVCAAGSGGHHAVNYPCICGETAGFGSFADCFVKGYNDSTVLEQFFDICEQTSGISMDMGTFWSNYTESMKHMDQHSDSHSGEDMEMSHTDSMAVSEYPVSINYTEFDLYKRYYQGRRNNNNVSVYYGYGMLAYWAFIIIGASVINWSIVLFPRLMNTLTTPFVSMYRKHIGLPATYGKNKATSIDYGLYLLPTRFETIVISGFYLLTAICNGVGIDTVPGNKVVPNLTADICLRVGVRTGITCGCLFPLIILFSGRNNILQFLTRWNYATYMTYHRWIAINATLLVIIHSITFTAYWVMVNSYITGMKPAYMIWGTVGTIVGSLMLVQSMLFLRRLNYEVFLFIHILMAFFYMLGSYYHTEQFGFGVFYLAAFIVWGLDRVIRLIRIATFGAPLATVELLIGETMKVTIPKPKNWNQIPGGYAFVHFLLPTCFWQSHPFSFTDCDNQQNTITMYIKVKGGATHGIHKYLLQSMEMKAQIRVLVEGPYGVPTHANNYENALFIAGGNGIPGIFSECIDLARKTASCGVKLVWIVRDQDSFGWFTDELEKLEELEVDVTICMTRFKQAVYSDDKEVQEKMEICSLDTLRASFPYIHFDDKKLDINEFVKEEIVNTNGSIAIITCGHEGMVDDVRYSVANNLDKSRYRVDFFEELQVWA